MTFVWTIDGIFTLGFAGVVLLLLLVGYVIGWFEPCPHEKAHYIQGRKVCRDCGKDLGEKP